MDGAYISEMQWAIASFGITTATGSPDSGLDPMLRDADMQIKEMTRRIEETEAEIDKQVQAQSAIENQAEILSVLKKQMPLTQDFARRAMRQAAREEDNIRKLKDASFVIWEQASKIKNNSQQTGTQSFQKSG
jgi:hypothetical protein